MNESRFFTLVRYLVLAYFLISVVAVISALSWRYQNLLGLEVSEIPGIAFEGWTSEELRSVLDELSFRPEWMAATRLAASLGCLLCFWVVAALLWRNRAGGWISLLAAAVLIGVAPGFSTLLLVDVPLLSWIRTPFQIGAALIWPTFFVTLYLFPNGRPAPRFTRYLFVVPYLLFIPGAFYPSLGVIALPILLAFALGGLVSQVYRYRRVSTPEERQQTKWVVAAMAIFVVVLILGSVIPTLFPALAVGTTGRFWYEYLSNATLGLLLPALIPLAIGISILRYRLWDIDVIIRKTLVYGTLTALLAAVYFGSVVLGQALFERVAGGQSPLVIVVSTLIIAALFSTLRRRVQQFIDRRFYRSKYDAARTLAEFAQHARDEVELEALTGEVARVVQETLQPEQLSVWLKPAVGGAKDIFRNGQQMEALYTGKHE